LLLLKVIKLFKNYSKVRHTCV